MPPRLRSLDAFRGLTVAAMLLVNNPGSWSYVYPPLAHAEWHGWTPTDLIFPFFLFIAGVALAFSLRARQAEGADRRTVLLRILRRGLVIILAGLLLNGFPYYRLDTLRWPGVLQRIGLVYLVAAPASLLRSTRAVASMAAALLLGYWGLMTLVPVPGYGPGVLEPVGNLAQYLDARLLAGHTWKAAWDPEGLLSTLPAIATCLLGALTGRWLRDQAPDARVAGRLAVVGALATGVGLAWGLVFPINKNLWTSSYAVFTAGAALLVLAACYGIIEVAGRAGWARPWLPFGTNPLLVFLGSGIMARLLLLVRVGQGDAAEPLQRAIYATGFASWAGPLNGSLAYALAFVLVWMAIAWALDRAGWRIRA